MTENIDSFLNNIGALGSKEASQKNSIYAAIGSYYDYVYSHKSLLIGLLYSNGVKFVGNLYVKLDIRNPENQMLDSISIRFFDLHALYDRFKVLYNVSKSTPAVTLNENEMNKFSFVLHNEFGEKCISGRWKILDDGNVGLLLNIVKSQIRFAIDEESMGIFILKDKIAHFCDIFGQLITNYTTLLLQFSHLSFLNHIWASQEQYGNNHSHYMQMICNNVLTIKDTCNHVRDRYRWDREELHNKFEYELNNNDRIVTSDCVSSRGNEKNNTQLSDCIEISDINNSLTANNTCGTDHTVSKNSGLEEELKTETEQTVISESHGIQNGFESFLNSKTINVKEIDEIVNSYVDSSKKKNDNKGDKNPQKIHDAQDVSIQNVFKDSLDISDSKGNTVSVTTPFDKIDCFISDNDLFSIQKKLTKELLSNVSDGVINGFDFLFSPILSNLSSVFYNIESNRFKKMYYVLSSFLYSIYHRNRNGACTVPKVVPVFILPKEVIRFIQSNMKGRDEELKYLISFYFVIYIYVYLSLNYIESRGIKIKGEDKFYLLIMKFFTNTLLFSLYDVLKEYNFEYYSYYLWDMYNNIKEKGFFNSFDEYLCTKYKLSESLCLFKKDSFLYCYRDTLESIAKVYDNYSDNKDEIDEIFYDHYINKCCIFKKFNEYLGMLKQECIIRILKTEPYMIDKISIPSELSTPWIKELEKSRDIRQVINTFDKEVLDRDSSKQPKDIQNVSSIDVMNVLNCVG